MNSLRCFAVILFFVSASTHARLTSNVDVLTGPSVFNLTGGTTKTTVSSSVSANVDYNLNHENTNTAYHLNFFESIKSSQGTLSITRLGLGAKFFILGFPSQRLIIDDKTEGRVWRASPFLGLGAGVSNFSVPDVGVDSRFYNAVAFDVQVKAGVEVPLNTNWILLGQVVLGMSLGSTSETRRSFAYNAATFLAGLKIESF